MKNNIFKRITTYRPLIRILINFQIRYKYSNHFLKLEKKTKKYYPLQFLIGTVNDDSYNSKF